MHCRSPPVPRSAGNTIHRDIQRPNTIPPMAPAIPPTMSAREKLNSRLLVLRRRTCGDQSQQQTQRARPNRQYTPLIPENGPARYPAFPWTGLADSEITGTIPAGNRQPEQEGVAESPDESGTWIWTAASKQTSEQRAVDGSRCRSGKYACMATSHAPKAAEDTNGRGGDHSGNAGVMHRVPCYFRSMVCTISRGKKSSMVQSISTRTFRSRPGSFET